MNHSLVLDPVKLNTDARQLLEQEGRLLVSNGIITLGNVGGARVWDFGVEATGSQQAGILLARISAADLLQVQVLDDTATPRVAVQSDSPVIACLGSQYAGWPVSVDKYFAMASGPGRSLRGREPVLEHFEILSGSSRDACPAVIVLESDHLPDALVVQKMASEMEVAAGDLEICVAPTHSLAGTLQIVARSLETALHQWEVQKGPLDAIIAGYGIAHLPPTGESSLQSIGWTNDSIIYTGEVTLEVRGSWENLQAIAGQVPSDNSSSFGQSFLTLFEASGRDFYKLDPRLFSPAILRIHDLATDEQAEFGTRGADPKSS